MPVVVWETDVGSHQAGDDADADADAVDVDGGDVVHVNVRDTVVGCGCGDGGAVAEEIVRMVPALVQETAVRLDGANYRTGGAGRC